MTAARNSDMDGVLVGFDPTESRHKQVRFKASWRCGCAQFIQCAMPENK